jgi:hypothetical protein
MATVYHRSKDLHLVLLLGSLARQKSTSAEMASMGGCRVVAAPLSSPIPNAATVCANPDPIGPAHHGKTTSC